MPPIEGKININMSLTKGKSKYLAKMESLFERHDIYMDDVPPYSIPPFGMLFIYLHSPFTISSRSVPFPSLPVSFA